MTNIPPRAVEEIYKVASISLSPNVPTQIFMGLMVSPPKLGDISYDQFTRESKGILESLRRRAKIMTDGFNSCKNVVCNFRAIFQRMKNYTIYAVSITIHIVNDHDNRKGQSEAVSYTR